MLVVAVAYGSLGKGAVLTAPPPVLPLTPHLQPVPREYYFGRNFGYIVALKSPDWLEWKWVTVADPEARRYVFKGGSVAQATEFQVKVKAYNSQGEGPYSLSAIIYSALDGELRPGAHGSADLRSGLPLPVVTLSLPQY